MTDPVSRRRTTDPPTASELREIQARHLRPSSIVPPERGPAIAPREKCDHICLLDAGHVERGVLHQYGYEHPSPRAALEAVEAERDALRRTLSEWVAAADESHRLINDHSKRAEYRLTDLLACHERLENAKAAARALLSEDS